jgi:hypothetical protein
MSWTTLMSLDLKPRKCKSLSIKAGCSAAEEFRLGDYTMASIKDDPYMKFWVVISPTRLREYPV